MSISKYLAKRLYNNNKSIGLNFRRKRSIPLINMIEEEYKKNGCVKIIDIGGTEDYWRIIPRDLLIKKNVKITIVNLPGTNKIISDNEIFEYIIADGCNLNMFSEKSFHIAHSNSVLEHVGDWYKVQIFVSELKRISSSYFVQTPNFWFPIEPHCLTPFIHWLPKPLRLFLISHFALGNWNKARNIGDAVSTIESVRLLNKKMFRFLFADSKIIVERYFLLPKSFVAIK